MTSTTRAALGTLSAELDRPDLVHIPGYPTIRHTLSEVAVSMAVRSALAQMDARTAAREYGEDAVKMTRHFALQRLAPEYARIAARLAVVALAGAPGVAERETRQPVRVVPVED